MIETPATILVVDDDPFTAELTGMILESAGFETVLAVGGGRPWKRWCRCRESGSWSRT